jgi:hypothetical protein
MSNDDVTASTLADTKIAVKDDPLIPVVKDVLAGISVEYDGESIDDVMQVFERAYYINHCGDSEVLHTCIYAMALQSSTTTKGLHAKATGRKGSGKSSAVAAALHLAPQETICKGSFSDMALFRKVMTIHHPRIMLDDVVLSEKQTANIKRATGAFQERCEHSTIVENKGVDFFIPERSVFFMTSVDEAGDDQLVDRFISLSTGIDAKDDLAYTKWEIEKRVEGRPDLIINEHVRLARSMLRYIATKQFTVHTPEKFAFAYINDRRLVNMVLDLMGAHAILYHMQRQSKDENGVSHIWADERDLNAIIHMSMFTRVDGEAETRLTTAEQRLNEMIQMDMATRHMETAIYSEQEIAKIYGKTLRTTRALLYGKDGSQQNPKGGLTAKVKWMMLVEGEGRCMRIEVRKHATKFFGQFANIMS